MLKKLQIKFVCINMTIVTIMLVIIFGLVLHFTSQSLETESLRMMEALAERPLQPGNPITPSGEIRLPYFTLQFGQKGEVIATGGGYYDLSDETFLNEIANAAFSSNQRTGILEQYQLRYYHILSPNQQYMVFADISSEQATLNHLIQTCIFIGILSFLIFFIISLLLAKWAIKPVEQAWNQQRQFVADASHELKTPLTVILANAELLQSSDFDEVKRAKLSANILTMSLQMRKLVENLLDLARVDNGSIQTSTQPMDLSEVVSNRILLFEPLYYEKDMVLTEHLESGIRVKGSQMQLQQVLDILLDNAMKYSSPHAIIHVELRRQGHYGILSVTNPGPTLSPEDLKHIFKRFYRSDKSRSQSNGYGLGLAIAEKIIHEHKGKIWAASQDGINTFSVQIPLCKK